MSFWRTFGFHTISPIENIIDRENFTLEELLDEDDILQETKAQNKKLLDYLAKPETLQLLFNYVLVEAEENAEAKRRFKYPFVCSEILCADVWSLGEVIFEHEALLTSLFAFFDKEGRLNPVGTGHVCKVMASLLQRKTGETLAQMKKKDDLIGKLLNHLDSAAVMDLLLKVISCEDPSSNSNGPSATLQWLADSALIPRLVARLDVAAPADLQDNVSASLIDIINASSSAPNSPLMAQLHSEEVFNKLLAYSLSERSTHYGLNVIVELLNRAAQDTHNATAQLTDLPPYVRVLLAAMDKYKALLVTPADAKPVLFSFGAIVPLGFVRLKVVELIAALLRLNYKCVSGALASMSAPCAVFDLFFQYRYNNFLHAIVRSVVTCTFAGDDQDLKLHLLQACKLSARLIEVVRQNADEEAKPKGIRTGLMGFAIHMASDLANAARGSPALAAVLKELDSNAWQAFEDGPLKELKNTEDEPLGGQKPSALEQMEDEPESGEIVLKYLVQQGFSTKGMSFAQEVQEEDDDDDDEDRDRTSATEEYLARGMYSTDGPNRGGDAGSGSSSDEDEDEDDDSGDRVTPMVADEVVPASQDPPVATSAPAATEEPKP